MLGTGSVKLKSSWYQALVIPTSWGALQVLWGLITDQKPWDPGLCGCAWPLLGRAFCGHLIQHPLFLRSVATLVLIERSVLPCSPHTEQLDTSHDLHAEKLLEQCQDPSTGLLGLLLD